MCWTVFLKSFLWLIIGRPVLSGLIILSIIIMVFAGTAPAAVPRPCDFKTLSAGNNLFVLPEGSMLAPGEPWETPYFEIDGALPGPVFVVLGGTHGDEPAGWQAVLSLQSACINRGRLVLIPFANRRAVEKEVRKLPGERDLNRSYPGDSGGEPVERLAAAIIKFLKESDAGILLDLHESIHFYIRDEHYLGQTIIAYQDADCVLAAYLALEELNRSIPGGEEKFSLLHQPVRGSTSWAAGRYLKIPAYTIETCQELDIAERVNYQQRVIKKIMEIYGVDLKWEE